MARNGSGTMSIPNSFSSGATITASGHNQNNTDIASELTNSVAADGQTSMTGPLKAANGTAAAPTVTFASDTDTGMYRHGANELGFSVNGTLAGWFDSSLKFWAIGALDVAGTFSLAGVAAFPVPTAQIANDAVTYAKIQNVSATARLLGRTTAGAGDVEEISLASGLSFVAGVLTPTISPTLIPNYLSGLTMSTAGSSGTMSIAAGVANDSTNATLMSLSAIAKTTASWAVGTGNGGLDTGAIANSTWYHFYVIQRTDTNVVDVLFSLSASAPTMPTNYTLKRRIGSGKTDGSGQWVLFTQTGDNFIWSASVTDVNAIATVASRVNKVLTVPTGVVTTALFRAYISQSANGNIIFTSLQESDQTPSSTGLADLIVSGTNTTFVGNFARLTDTSAQIGVRATGTSNTYSIFTYGWIDSRGK